MDDETPKLSLATETEPHELEKAQALRELAWPTREMAANLLRVMRGAGRPAYLPQQLINLSDQILELTKTCRPWAIWSAIEDTLQSAIPDWFDEAEGDAHKGSIAKGALQFLASRLVYQRAQEAAGRREMAEAIREMDRYHERQREKYRQEEARFRVEQQKPKRRISPKPKPKSAAPPIAKPSEPEAKGTVEFMRQRQRQLRDEE